MSQFRTSADIFTEVLQKSGEPTNGNSSFQTIAMTYINKVHHAIVGGGSIINVNVDEPWVWARHRHPIVLEMQPAYTSGTITATNNSTNITFQTASSVSLEGWHFQVNGKSTVYKITNHTAAGTTAQLDSNFVDNGGVYTFRCFKIDYPVYPAFLYIDNSNDQIDFQEVTIGTASTTSVTLATSLQHGSYSPGNLLTSLIAQLNLVGTASYGGSYDSVANTFFLTAANCQFNLLGATGTNVKRSMLTQLGFDVLDQTGAQSYVSTYQPNQVSRLIEPFKMFMSNWGSEENFCYSTDPIKMQEDYPIALITQRFPERFSRISEDSSGVIWVRFNSYPSQITKLQVDWVKQPLDLQNNTASFSKLPRADVDALIHGASAYILWDKEDSKWEGMLKLCSGQLDAMKKKNHDLLFRTGQDFGQIVPRQDLAQSIRRLNYGYTINGSTAAQTTSSTTQVAISTTLLFSQFQTASTAHALTASTLPANMTLYSLILKNNTAWTGTGVTACVLNIGTAANPTQFINAFNLAQTTASTGAILLYFPALPTAIQAQVVSSGANLANLVQGSTTVYFQETITQ